MRETRLNEQAILALRAQAIESASMGVAILSPTEGNLLFLDVNDAFARLMGYTSEQLAGQSLNILQGPRTDTYLIGRAIEAVYCGSSLRGSLIAYRQDMKPLPVEYSISARCDEQGEIEYVLITARNATDSKRDHDAQLLTNRMSAHFREGATPGDVCEPLAAMMVPDFADWCTVHLQDEDGTFRLMAVANRLDEQPKGDLETDVRHEGIGVVTSSTIPLVHQPSEPNNPALAGQMSAILGKPVHAILTVPIAVNPSRSFGAISWVVTDDHREYVAADREVAEEAAAKLGHHLEAFRIQDSLSNALLARERFLSVAGHELRTPVVSIKGYTQLLLRDLQRRELSRERIESGLKTIEASTSRLTALTEDIFTMYNAGYASVPLHLKSVLLLNYLHDFLSNAQKHFLHGHTLDYAGMTDDAWVQLDVVRFSQVLYNLINNAERFSAPDTPIRIATSLVEDGVIISVTDEGKGLSSGEDEDIFNPFVSSRPLTSYEQQQGLGISLHITRKIVERHHGRIWAESPGPNKGTTFRIHLPTLPEPNDPPGQ